MAKKAQFDSWEEAWREFGLPWKQAEEGKGKRDHWPRPEDGDAWDIALWGAFAILEILCQLLIFSLIGYGIYTLIAKLLS